jgi:hypothetical protein
MALIWGCSSGDKTTGSGGNGDEPSSGRYVLEGWFGGAVVEGSFGMWVGRIDSTDASAQDCHVTINDSSLTAWALLSDDADAFFSLLAYDYVPNQQYTIRASLAGKIATCSFTGPEYPWITITSPTGDSFAPGEEIQLVWEYDPGTPENVYVTASAQIDQEEVILLEQELNGSHTSYTISEGTTENWGSYDDILITVDGGEDAWPFTGDLAAIGSTVFTALPGDAIILYPGGSQPETTWYITVTLDDYWLDADGQSTTSITATLEDEFLDPCDDGTLVTFWAEPGGYVTIDPATAQTTGGEAVTTLTVGTTAPESGDPIEIHAAALGDSAYAGLTLDAIIRITVGTGQNPEIGWTPGDTMMALLVRQAGIEIGNLRWSIAGYLGPPVTYGTTPGTAGQVYPPLMGAPDPLETGVDYRILLVNTVGDTTSYEFTR